jgi:alkanesulfonate monooxygenase SsuD/methylene tetrahydromethanopterin reductase-like flavin-dependent oxidoreductase (luciferase family)
VSSPEELELILAHPLAAWRTAMDVTARSASLVREAREAREPTVSLARREARWLGALASGILPVMMIGVGLDARLGLPFDQLRAAAREAERLGFESLWTPAGGVPDAFHLCAAWSRDTSLRTGISVVPAARMWTPPGLATQAATLAQLSSGRFVLGLGTGGYGPEFWSSVGLPDRPIAVMREYVTEVRGLLAGQQVTAGPILARPGENPGAPGWPRSSSLGLADLPPAPVYLAALGPQMLRLAGEVADGALLNWATPERIAVSRERIDAGAARAGREPGSVPMTMYIRVCVDDDVAAAREAFGAQVLGYAMGRAGTPQGAGYRGLFAQMGFDAELSELEQRRDRGAAMSELVAAAPDEMLQAVGYYGPAAPAPAAFARLSAGLDEAIVRIVTARPGLEPASAAMAALAPSLIRDA